MNCRRILSLSYSLLLALPLILTGCDAKKKTPPEDTTIRTGARAALHHTRTILDFGPRPAQSEALQKTREYIQKELAKSGWQTTTEAVRYNAPRWGATTFTNVIARYGEAQDESLWDRPVKGLLSAHIDSKHIPGMQFVGADDAASAVGTILELARQFSELPEIAKSLELVFFDGEEAVGRNINIKTPPFDGLYGSREYAKRWRTATNKPSFGINLDMIGHRNLRVSYPRDTPLNLEAALLAAARAEGEEARFTKHSTPIIDDHVPLNQAGIPTIDIIGEFRSDDPNTWWHTERDNISLISRESLDITLRVTHRMISDLLQPDS